MKYGCMFGGSTNSIVSPAPLSTLNSTPPNSDLEQPPEYSPFDELSVDMEAIDHDPYADDEHLFFSPRGFDSP